MRHNRGVYLDEELWQKFRVHCEERDVSQSSLLELMIMKELGIAPTLEMILRSAKKKQGV